MPTPVLPNLQFTDAPPMSLWPVDELELERGIENIIRSSPHPRDIDEVPVGSLNDLPYLAVAQRRWLGSRNKGAHVFGNGTNDKLTKNTSRESIAYIGKQRSAVGWLNLLACELKW